MKGLSLDGGGVFGITQALILSAVKDLDKFDFFVGTSIGSVTAAFCASGGKPGELPAFFQNRMPKIFKGNSWRRYKFFTPKYPDKELNSALQSLLNGPFGNTKKPLFVTAADLNTRKLKVFSSSDPSDATWPLWEVCRAATAAETYFNPWKGKADGGIFANNPAMVAVAAACKQLGGKIEDLELISIGTGVTTGSSGSVKNRTFLGWGLWLLEVLLSGASNSMHEFFVRSMPVKRYERIQFVRKAKWRMDCPDDMLQAQGVWHDQIQDAIKRVNEF